MSEEIKEAVEAQEVKEPELYFEVKDHVAYVRINRPERRNAIGREVRRQMIEAFCEVNDNPEIWGLVLTGTGDKAFCAGGDLKENKERADQKKRVSVPMTGPDRNIYECLLECYKPTICVLNGSSYGGGTELALACDIRIAAEGAKMCLPEAKRGMGANFGSTLLPRMIPRAVAMKALYTGEPLSTEDCLKYGLVTDVVPYDQLEQATADLVARIFCNAPVTLRRYKHVAVKGWDLPIHQVLRADFGPNPYLSEDRKEGVKAFSEKRKPNWQNK